MRDSPSLKETRIRRDKMSNTIPTDKLQRLVGLVLAKKAADFRRKQRKYSYYDRYDSEREMAIKQVKDGVLTKLTGSFLGDGWWDLDKQITQTMLRKALKHWEEHKKVIAHRRGRYGNCYRWVLLSEQNQPERRKRKRAALESKQEVEKAEREKREANTRAIADMLAEALTMAPGSFRVWDDNITIKAGQANTIISILSLYRRA